VVWRVDEGAASSSTSCTTSLWTLVVLALVLVTAVLVFLGGALSEFVFDQIGLGSTTAAIWRYARWPAAVLAMILIYAVVYFAAPNVEIRRLAVDHARRGRRRAAWLLATRRVLPLRRELRQLLRDLRRVRRAVILLVWLWLTNPRDALRGELNAVIDLRARRSCRRLRRPPPQPASSRGQLSPGVSSRGVTRAAGGIRRPSGPRTCVPPAAFERRTTARKGRAGPPGRAPDTPARGPSPGARRASVVRRERRDSGASRRAAGAVAAQLAVGRRVTG
jgi:hypothetical protein